MSKVQCPICPHRCVLEEGQTGFCNARSNHDGTVMADNYGKITAIALDPIEKKPLRRFHPGSSILSVGSYGCNLRCSFCQNYAISMADGQAASGSFVAPSELVDKAKQCVPRGNIGIAFTYNEPLIGYEYVRDCALLAAEQGLITVLVTNGYINAQPIDEILPYIDAMNIDLKAFGEAFYQKVGGHLAPVQHTIARAAKQCHVEVTTLIIPGENDSEQEMRALSSWLASVDENIPLHVARFFPCHQMMDKAPTSVDTIFTLARIAREQLKYVFEGNC